MNKLFIKSLLLIGIALFEPNSAYADFSFNNMELKFAQISDSHISDAPDTTYKVLSRSKELLNSTIKEVNGIKGLDFVVFTGDMVNEPTKKLYRDFLVSLTQLNYPSILVFGNHDSVKISEGNEYLDKETVWSIIKRSNPYQDYGLPYFAYSPSKDYRVIVLDTTMGYEHESNGFLPDEQLEFLDSELANNQDKIILIFQHHPVIEPFKSNDHKLLNANAYLEILKKYEKVPIGIFAGHYHAAKIIRKGNVLHVASPSLVTYPNAFRTVSITNYKDRVIFNFKFHETNLKNVQNMSKAGILASNLFAGMPSDRNAEVMIRKGYVPKETVSKEEIKASRIEAKEKKQAEKAAKKAAKQEKRAKKKAKKETVNSTEE
ncbi:MAG: metallophosphoesterase [bacterium]|nr:metallophosphoesterase [bacterium]